MTDYTLLCSRLRALTEGVPHVIANLANASALLYDQLDRLNWAGFYLMQQGMLVLGPFQGKPACIQIAVGKGVCGTAKPSACRTCTSVPGTLPATARRNRKSWCPSG